MSAGAFAFGKRFRSPSQPGALPASRRRLFGFTRKFIASRVGGRRVGRRIGGSRLTTRQHIQRGLRRRRRLFGRGRRKFGFRRRRRRIGFRRRVIQALTVPMKFSNQYGSQFTVPDTTSNAFECVYFTAEVTNTAVTTRDDTRTASLGGLFHLAQAADQVWPVTPVNVGGGQVNLGYTTQDIRGRIHFSGNCLYRIRNQANETVNITAYYCVGRKDWAWEKTIPPVSNYYNVYYPLATGFAALGNDINVGNPNSNTSMRNDAGNPYHSHHFTKLFRIYKQKNVKIDPSEEMSFRISMKNRSVQPEDLWRNPGSTATSFQTRIPRFDFKKGEKFILFKLHSRPSGVTGQTTTEKQIAHTTPTVLLYSQFWYSVRFLEQLARPNDMNFINAGITNTGTKAITVDNTLVAGEEKDSS